MRRFIASLALFLGLAVAHSASALDPFQCAPLPSGFIRDGNTNCGRMMSVNADGSINVAGTLTASFSGFTPTSATSNTTLTATTTSSSTALPSGATIVVQNTGATTAYVTFGVGSATATTAGYPVQANTAVGFSVGSNTFIAGITSSGSDLLLISGGSGFPSISGGATSGGGGGGGAVTIADGANVTAGALANTAWDGVSANPTAQSILKGMAAQVLSGASSLVNINHATPGVTDAVTVPGVTGTKAPGTAAASSILIGGVYNSAGVALSNGQQAGLQFTNTGALITSAGAGLAQGSTTSGQTGGLSMGAVTTSAPTYTTAQTNALSLDPSGNLRVINPTGFSTAALQGAQGTGSTYNPPTGGSGEIGFLSGIYAAAIDPTPVAVNLAAATTGGCTPYGYQSAASNNATNIKSTAGTLCSLTAINTTAVIYYLRFYNSTAAPTCSSGTNFFLTIPVPAATAGAGAVVDLSSFGWAFSSGISFCLTGGGASNDNTSAAAGVYLAASYK